MIEIIVAAIVRLYCFSGVSTPIEASIFCGRFVIIIPVGAVSGPFVVFTRCCPPVLGALITTGGLPASCQLRTCTADPTCGGRLMCTAVTSPTINVPGTQPTIQAAINSAPATGALILVGPGTYPERPIILNKNNITLRSTVPGGAIIVPVLSGGINPVVVTVDGSLCAQILDFTIIAPSGPTGRNDKGIFVENGGTAIIRGNVITTDTLNPITGFPITGQGIRIDTGSAALIENNIINNYQKNGITVNFAGTCAHIRNNQITGAGPTVILAQNGIQISRGATAVVEGNTLTNNFYTGSRAGPDLTNNATGILIFEDVATAPVCLLSNTLSGNNAGIMFDPASIVVNSGVLTQLNNSTNNEYGILVGTTSCNNTFVQNTVLGNSIFDIADLSMGNGSAGTADVYLCNKCVTDSPVGICASTSGPPTIVCTPSVPMARGVNFAI